MKKILVSALLCASLFAAAQAQTTHTVKLVDTQLQDVLNVLEDMDIYIHRFDVSQFLDATYHMEVYVEEYKGNQKTGRVHHFDLGKNIRSLDEIPEEHRNAFRETYQIPAGKKEKRKLQRTQRVVQPPPGRPHRIQRGVQLPPGRLRRIQRLAGKRCCQGWVRLRLQHLR